MPGVLPLAPFPILDSHGRSLRATIGEELRVAAPYCLADLTNKYELDTRLWDVATATGGTVTHVPTWSALRATVTGTTGSRAELCTNTYYKYQAGYLQHVTLSIVHADAGQTNQVREWGYFDTENGLFWRLTGTALALVERTSTSGAPVETVVAKAAWNQDVYAGLDLTKGNLYEIEVQWFGVGTVRYFINGVLVHEAAHGNTVAGPYLTTAQLPVAARVVNTGASVGSSLSLICARVVAQGQTQPPQEWISSTETTTGVLVGLTEIPLLSLRPKALYNGVINRAWLLPRVLSLDTESRPVAYGLRVGGTLTGAAWTSAGTRSAAEFDMTASAITGGDEILHGHVEPDLVSAASLTPFFSILGLMLRRAGFNGSGVNTTDVVTVTARNAGVGRTDVRTHLTWAEVR